MSLPGGTVAMAAFFLDERKIIALCCRLDQSVMVCRLCRRVKREEGGLKRKSIGCLADFYTRAAVVIHDVAPRDLRPLPGAAGVFATHPLAYLRRFQ
jgi:hypothetical protein